MNRSRNQNQHALVEVLPIKVNSTDLLAFTGTVPPQVAPPMWDSAIGGIVVADIPNGGETQRAKFNVNIALAFSSSTELRGLQVISTLKDLHLKVETIVAEIAGVTARITRP